MTQPLGPASSSRVTTAIRASLDTPPAARGRHESPPPSLRFSEILAERRPSPLPAKALPIGNQPAGAPTRPSGPLAASPVAPGPESPDGLAVAARKTLGRLFAEERAIDRSLAAAMSGRSFSPQELIAMQAQVIRYSQELDVASRMVERLTSAVKQVLSTQV